MLFRNGVHWLSYSQCDQLIWLSWLPKAEYSCYFKLCWRRVPDVHAFATRASARNHLHTVSEQALRMSAQRAWLTLELQGSPKWFRSPSYIKSGCPKLRTQWKQVNKQNTKFRQNVWPRNNTLLHSSANRHSSMTRKLRMVWKEWLLTGKGGALVWYMHISTEWGGIDNLILRSTHRWSRCWCRGA